MLISIGAYDLCDGILLGSVGATGLRLRFTRGIEVVPTLGEADPQTYDRGTRTLDLSFTVKRVHSSVKQAERFIARHEHVVPQSGDVKLTSASGAIAFVDNGFLVELQLIEEIGASTSHSYRIVGGVFNAGVPRPNTLNQVISTGISIGLWPVVGVPTPTTLNEVIDAGTTLGLWPSGPVPVTPTTLNQVIAAGTALDLWD